MKNERKKYDKVLIFAVLFAVLAFIIIGVAQAATITVCPSGCDYSDIQEAVNAANPRDTIEVYSGTYYENVNINKRLTLQGVDTGGGKPVVDAGVSGSAIMLSADGIMLEGFKAINSGWGDAGIEVTSNNNTIINNIASSNNKDGISLYYSNNNTMVQITSPAITTTLASTFGIPATTP